MNNPTLARTAQFYAFAAHRGQRRKNRAGDPLIMHAQEVADLVRRSGGNDFEIAAAWLHDVVEDTPHTLDQLRDIFGAEVSELVDGLTDPKHFEGMPLSERKALQAERVASKSSSVKRVKLADQISNVRSVGVDPPIEWNRDKRLAYAEGARKIAEKCQGVSLFLDEMFEKVYTQCIHLIGT